MSVLRDRGLLRERRDCPSTTSMDDWYLEVCKRNVHKLSVVGMPQPRVYRPRSGSFKDTVKIVTGDAENGNNDTLAVSHSGSGKFSSRHSPARKTSSSPATTANVFTALSLVDAMKRMHTDPRILTGQKGASTLTQWYDNEVTGVTSEDHNSFGSCTEFNSPDSVQNQSRLNVSEVTDGHQVTPELVIRDRLMAKINRTNDQLISEQKAKQLSVNEYLRLSSSILPMERAQAQRVKAAFERRNQKSTAVVAQLQRKLESYKQRLKEVESSRRLSSGSGGITSATGSPWPAFDLLKGIRSGISGFSGTIVTKPRVIADMIRNKFGSADNISSMRDMDDSEAIQETNATAHRVGNTLPAGFRCYSHEDLSKLGVTSPSSIALSPIHAASSPLHAASRHVNLQDGSANINLDIASVLECLKSSQGLLKSQRDEVFELGNHLAASRQKWEEEIEMERAQSENLIDRLNDLSDVHQDELIAVKQELSMFEEKLEYQLDERMRDMHDMVDNCHNRLAKLEVMQHRTTEGIDNSYVRPYVVKLINVGLSFLALLLIVISFVINLLHPLLNTRSHLLVTASCFAVAAAVWYSWNTLTAHTNVEQTL